MRTPRVPRSRSLQLAVACVLACSLALPATAAGFDERRSVSAAELVLRNLIGEIRIEGHDGSAFEIELHIAGADATRERIEIDLREGARAELTIKFPLAESRDYVYPGMGGSKTRFRPDDEGSWLSQLLGGSRGVIEVSGRGKGLELWVDATIRVPRGSELAVDHGVGRIHAGGVHGSVTLSTQSGQVEVSDMTGPVVVDTGSGHVSAGNIDGTLSVDTGSGNVEVRASRGGDVTVDTGSGSVVLESIETGKLRVDTGSGSVSGRGIGADQLRVDTGSGSVELEVARMGRGTFDIDTGSGGIRLDLPPDASASVHASTGSGGIDLDDPGDRIRVKHRESDEAELVIGDGAAAMLLDTGSGGIRIKVR